jgi:hypothetical protein
MAKIISSPAVIGGPRLILRAEGQVMFLLATLACVVPGLQDRHLGALGPGRKALA